MALKRKTIKAKRARRLAAERSEGLRPELDQRWAWSKAHTEEAVGQFEQMHRQGYWPPGGQLLIHEHQHADECKGNPHYLLRWSDDG